MAKDPAFLFYSADASEDVSHMNRLERGAYFDFIQAQRKFHGITTEQARKILGKDFEEVWPALELILSKDETGFFIPWMREGIEQRKAHAEKQRKKIQKYWDDKKAKESFHGNSTELPLENGNGIVNEEEIKKGVKIHFNVFWDAYGKRLGNLYKLEQYWQGLPESEQKAILKFIPEYKKFQPDARFRLNPEKFFEDQFWKGELPKQEKEEPKTRWNRLTQ